jgi:hypothetical protein
VVWNIWTIFPYIGNVIIPFDFHIFQSGGSTTNQYISPIGQDIGAGASSSRLQHATQVLQAAGEV